MAGDPSEWRVLEHGPLIQLDEHLWHVEGAVPNMALRRRMVVARRTDGSLVLHNGVALDEATMAELDALGPVSTILVPNGFHRLDAARFRARYPKAQLLCPAGARDRVAKVTTVDGSYQNFQSDERVHLEPLGGVRDAEGVMIIHGTRGTTVVFNDVLFNLRHGKGLGGLVFRIVGSTGGPKVTRIARTFLVKDKAELRRDFERIADIGDLSRVIPGHGRIIDSQPGDVLRSVAATL